MGLLVLASGLRGALRQARLLALLKVRAPALLKAPLGVVLVLRVLGSGRRRAALLALGRWLGMRPCSAGVAVRASTMLVRRLTSRSTIQRLLVVAVNLVVAMCGARVVTPGVVELEELEEGRLLLGVLLAVEAKAVADGDWEISLMTSSKPWSPCGAVQLGWVSRHG